MEKLSVLIPAYNNEKIIRQCLESIKWADEILVCDSFSTDQTLEIAKEYGAKIIQHEYANSARQKNWAIPQCRYDWVFVMDTDEELEEGAKEEILHFLKNPPLGVDASRLARKNMILGKWMTVMGLWPDYVTRLFKKTARYQEKEVHADVMVSNPFTFKHAIIHHSTPTLSKQIGYLDRYTRYQADEFVKQGRRFRWWRILFRPPAAFFYYFFYKKGFTAGFRGFFLSVHAATYSFYTYAKLWELEELNLRKSP